MNRERRSPPLPARRLLLRAALAVGGVAAAAPAPVMASRTLPDSVELGRLRLGVFPEATLDGRPVRLGPGTRIRDEHNIVRPPSTVTGDRRVAFRRGAMGEIVEVWLLTDDEHRALAARIAAARRAAAQR